MRLFVAIRFSPAIKAALLEAEDALRALANGGNFTRPENLHLTLAFIGETREIAKAKEALSASAGAAFSLTVGGKPGSFGDLWWIGVRAPAELNALASRLRTELQNRGVPVDAKPFRPHVTLARELRLSKPVTFLVPEAEMRAEQISLMKSERLNGRLVYTEVFSVPLGGQA